VIIPRSPAPVPAQEVEPPAEESEKLPAALPEEQVSVEVATEVPVVENGLSHPANSEEPSSIPGEHRLSYWFSSRG
jgi:hypothetical protein